jgi:hypothetical protein
VEAEAKGGAMADFLRPVTGVVFGGRRRAMKLFSEHVRFVNNVVRARWSLVDAGSDRNRLQRKVALAQSYPGVVICMAISLVIVGISGAALIYSPDEQVTKWSAGFVGFVIGYWFR